jgi:hypothetical protein
MVSAQRQTGGPKAIRQKAEVTDADEAFEQHRAETKRILARCCPETGLEEINGDLLEADFGPRMLSG